MSPLVLARRPDGDCESSATCTRGRFVRSAKRLARKAGRLHLWRGSCRTPRTNPLVRIVRGHKYKFIEHTEDVPGHSQADLHEGVDQVLPTRLRELPGPEQGYGSLVAVGSDQVHDLLPERLIDSGTVGNPNGSRRGPDQDEPLDEMGVAGRQNDAERGRPRQRRRASGTGGATRCAGPGPGGRGHPAHRARERGASGLRPWSRCPSIPSPCDLWHHARRGTEPAMRDATRLTIASRDAAGAEGQ